MEAWIIKKAERSWRSEDLFNNRYEHAEFGVYPAGFQCGFGPVFPLYATFPLFGMAMQILFVCMLNICNLFNIYI